MISEYAKQLNKLVDQLEADNAKLTAEVSRLKEEFVWAKRNRDENDMLLQDYLKIKAERDKYREALERIAITESDFPDIEPMRIAKEALRT